MTMVETAYFGLTIPDGSESAASRSEVQELGLDTDRALEQVAKGVSSSISGFKQEQAQQAAALEQKLHGYATTAQLASAQAEAEGIYAKKSDVAAVNPIPEAERIAAMIREEAEKVERLSASTQTLQKEAVQQILADEVPEINTGEGLRLRQIVGNGGYRMLLESTDRANPNIMPYFEVRAASTGNDVGGAIGGYQAHWIGDGTTPSTQDRLYWGVELLNLEKKYFGRNDLAGAVQIFVSSRNGVPLRAMIMAANARPALTFHGLKPHIELMRNTALTLDDRAYPDAGMGTLHESYINFRRESAVGMALSSFTGVAQGGAYVFLSRHRGSVQSPEPPSPGDALGRYSFGLVRGVDPDRVDKGTRVETAWVRAVATGTWDLEAVASRGSRIELVGTERGTTQADVVGSFDFPSGDGQTGMGLQVQRGSERRFSYVTVGPPNSAGEGFRALRVTN